MKSFKEYINAKGILVSPTIKDNGDAEFPKAEKPFDKANVKTNTPTFEPAPYRAKGLTNSEKALGELGSVPVYDPNVKDNKEEEMLKQTKGQPTVEGFSLAELTRFIQGQNKLLREGAEADSMEVPTITAWSTGKIMPDPLETVEYITHLASQNANLMEQLIRNLKRKGSGMHGVMGSILNQPESYDALVGHLEGEDGPKHASCLCNSMGDSYRKYMDEFSELHENALSPPIGIEMGEEEVEDMENDDEETPMEELPDDMTDDEKEPELPKRVPKRKFAHHHLIENMSNLPHVREDMVKHCSQY